MGNTQDPNQASKTISFHFFQTSWEQVPSGGANNYMLTMTEKFDDSVVHTKAI